MVDPITRKETFLAKAGGQDVTTPTPVTREEYFLNQIAKGGGSGGGVLVVRDVDGTLDKTWQEIHDADFAVIKVDKFTMPVYEVIKNGTYSYLVHSMKYQSSSLIYQEYTASSASNYPTAVSAGGGGND